MTKNRALRLSVMALILAVVVCMLATINLVKAEEVSTAITITCKDKTVTIDEVDPIKLEREGTTALKMTERAQVEWEGKNYVYTGNFYKMNSYPRVGAVEYAIIIVGGIHKITKEYAPISGSATVGNPIPVPGYLLSATSDLFNVNDVLKVANGASFENIKFSVDNETKQTRLVPQSQNAKANGLSYFDPDYSESKLPVAGSDREVSFKMIMDGDNAGKFNPFYFKGGGNKNQTPINPKGFVLSGSYATVSLPISNIAYVVLKKDYFVETDVISISGKDYFGLDYEVSTDYNCVDPTPEKGFSFPESENRGLNELMIYTKSVINGGNILGTNVYGYESAINSDGIIINSSINVGIIPEGGFVVSGNGTRRPWLKEYMKNACRVVYDDTLKILTVQSTLQSVVAELITTYDGIAGEVQSLEYGMYDVDNAKLKLVIDDYNKNITRAKEIQTLFSAETKPTKAAELELKFEIKGIMANVAPYARDISQYMIESRTIGARAAWHVPNITGKETTLENMIGELQTLKDCGINTIYLEIYGRGYSHFISNVFPLHPNTSGFTYGEYPDYGTAYITEATKLGIDVFGWLDTCYLGRKAEALTANPKSLVSQIKDGKLDNFLNYTNSSAFDTLGNSKDQIFADPANATYKKMIIDYAAEMVKKYPSLAGVNLDYIRYPDNTNGGAGYDVGYTEVAMNEFLAKYGYTFPGCNTTDLVSKRMLFYNFTQNDETIKKQWIQHRVDYVTQIVVGIKNAVIAANPKSLISTATGPNAKDSYKTLYQDWGNWVETGLIDICTPMAYFDNASAVLTTAKKGLDIVGGMSYSYVGISPYLNTTPKDVAGDTATVTRYAQQVKACLDAGSMGYSIFSTEQLLGSPRFTDAYAQLRRESLMAGANRNTTSVTPHNSADKILQVAFGDILDKATRIYVAKEGMTETQKTALASEFTKIQAMPIATSSDLNEIYKALKTLQSKSATFGNLAASARIAENIGYIMENIDIKITRNMIRNGEWNPSESKIRPSLDKKEEEKPVIDDSWKPVAETEGCSSKILFRITMPTVVIVAIGVTLLVLVLLKKRKNKE